MIGYSDSTKITYSQEEVNRIIAERVELGKQTCIAVARMVRDEEKDSGSNTCPPCQYHTADLIINLIEAK